MLLLHLPDAIEAYGDDRDAEILGEEADAGLEGNHIRGVAVVDDAFGEDQKAVTTVCRFAGEPKAFAETGKLWQRENIEKRDRQEIAELPEPAFGEEPVAGRMAVLAQHFAAHGGGEAMAETSGKRKEDEADIGAARGVVGDKEHRAFEIGEKFAATDARVAKEKRGGPGERVIDEKPKKAHRGALCPARIDIVRAASGGLRDKLLNIGEGLRVGELRFVEFDVVAMLKGREEFDAVERRQVFERGKGSREGEGGGGFGGGGCWRTEEFGGAGGDYGETRFAGGRAWKVQIGPDEPPADALVIGEGEVGGIDGGSNGSFVGALTEQYSAGLGVVVNLEGNDDGVTNCGLGAESGLEILGINIQAGGGDDDVFLAAAEAEIALGVEFAQIAGAQPATVFLGTLPQRALLPIARGDIFPADENLSIFGETEFAAGQDFADGPLRGAEWMIQADQGGGFGHAIALHDGVPDAFEEFLGFGRKRRAAGDERPELPTEAPVDKAKHPSTTKKFARSG